MLSDNELKNIMGRHKKPTEKKLVEGTYRPDRHPKNQMTPAKYNGVPSPPEEMQENEKACEIWNVTVGELFSLKMLYAVDMPLIAAYCFEMALYFEIKKAMRQVKDYNKIRFTASVGNQALDRATKLAMQFGLTPAARTKIEAPKEKETDEFENL